jgi:uncharacterized protein
MAVQVSYPGVYVEEFAPGAPIQGVGTSTAAFIGPASRGELNIPTKITSWDQFRATFGEYPLPGFFQWYAVRGFFENGGQVCYVVRATNGSDAGLGLETPPTTALEDRAGNHMLRVRARQPGVPAPPIQIEVTGTNLIPLATTSLFQPTSSYTAIDGRNVTLNAGDGVLFRPNDSVSVGDERAQILRITGDTLRLGGDLVLPHGPAGPVRLADALVGTRTVRIESTAPVPPGVVSGTLPPNVLVQGTLLTISQLAVSDTQVVETVQAELLATMPSPTMTYRVSFRQGLAADFSLDPANPAGVQSEEFDVEVSQGAVSTTHRNLSIDAGHPRYFVRTINDAEGGLVLVETIEPPPPAAPPSSLPADTVGPVDLIGGQAEDLATLNDANYIAALDTLREVDDVNLVAIPDCVRLADPQPATVQQALIAHCEQIGDRFAVLDAHPGLELFGGDSIETQRRSLDSTRGYAALYYPWLRVLPAGTGGPIIVPPSGHVCGIIAKSDNTRGVHKAPANEIVSGALGVERNMSDIDQGQLNLQGINVVRLFPTGGRPVLWGARTTATDRNWQYVNIRRLFLFLEESIQEGIRWAVFEPNNPGLWEKLRRSITEFLTRVWRDGALFGETAEQAFYVRIDETLNPDSTRALGRLYIEVGVRPSYPAEFIIVRIGVWQGGAEVTER